MRGAALTTDLYELTMAAAYFENGLNPNASFELFVRSLPNSRGYLLAAGLEQALEYLENLRFTADQIEFLRQQPIFSNVGDAFFDYLRTFRFTGEVWAMEEGTPFFTMEPVLRVTAPVIEAQIVETYLLTTLTFQTTIATKAARCVQSAAGRAVIEFGSRRAHGPEAGVLAARAAYVGGCAGSSNVEASYRFGIPTFGTLAHSFIAAYADERRSFEDFCRVFPNDTVLLLDTYDTLAAVDKINAAGLRPKGVRLDSGDVGALSKQVRSRLDRVGLTDTKIVVSGDLDEHSIARLLASSAPIDVFGVGTALSTSKDAPALGGVYKLVEFNGQPTAKLSENDEKISYPGGKQIFRFAQDANYGKDIIALQDEEYEDGNPLLACVMREGRRTTEGPDIHEVRNQAAERISKLPLKVRTITNPAAYPVTFSTRVQDLLAQVRRRKDSQHQLA